MCILLQLAFYPSILDHIGEVLLFSICLYKWKVGTRCSVRRCFSFAKAQSLELMADGVRWYPPSRAYLNPLIDRGLEEPSGRNASKLKTPFLLSFKLYRQI